MMQSGDCFQHELDMWRWESLLNLTVFKMAKSINFNGIASLRGDICQQAAFEAVSTLIFKQPGDFPVVYVVLQYSILFYEHIIFS